MNPAEKLAVGALVSALAIVVPGFVLHTAPRFPGSLAGGLLGIAGAALFVLLLAYSLVKRSSGVKDRVTRHASLRAVLSFHVYAGVLGALLGITHSGHKFDSPLGIALVVAMLAVVFSGFAGHYALVQVGAELRDQQGRLAVLRTRYDTIAAALPGPSPAQQHVPIRRLIGGMADLEYAIGARDTLKRTLSRWTVLHVGAAIAMYALLALHIWSSVHYGLRWLG